MRAEFNNLYNAIMKTNYGQEVVIAMEKLEQKITEVEKRLECIDETAKEIHKSISNYTQRVDNNEVFVMSITDHDSILRGSNDVMIACDLSDDEPIINNWYQLFEEPKKEEPKVIWGKGTIIEWNESVKYYSAKGGARARVTEDYTTLCEMVKVEFLDDLRNGQENGGYYGYMFKDEPITELSSNGVPYRYCHHCSIKEEETVMGQVNGFWLCCDCHDETKDDEEENVTRETLEVAPTELCKTPQTHEFVKDIIAKLKVIDVDGETMEYILEQVGMSEQMLKQLARKDPKETMEIIAE